MKIQTAEHLQYVYGYVLYTYNMYIDVYYNLISTEKVYENVDVIFSTTVISVKKHMLCLLYKELNEYLFYTVTQCTEILHFAKPLKSSIKIYC